MRARMHNAYQRPHAPPALNCVGGHVRPANPDYFLITLRLVNRRTVRQNSRSRLPFAILMRGTKFAVWRMVQFATVAARRASRTLSPRFAFRCSPVSPLMMGSLLGTTERAVRSLRVCGPDTPPPSAPVGPRPKAPCGTTMGAFFSWSAQRPLSAQCLRRVGELSH
jgi:hypothetical protein